MPQQTIDSNPNPQTITLVMAGIRILLLVLSGAGIITAEYTDQQLLPFASALVFLGGGAWEVYEQWRQQHMRHAAAVASARGARAVQHKDYSNA